MRPSKMYFMTFFIACERDAAAHMNSCPSGLEDTLVGACVKIDIGFGRSIGSRNVQLHILLTISDPSGEASALAEFQVLGRTANEG